MRAFASAVLGAMLFACSGRSEHGTKRADTPPWIPPEVDLGGDYERSGTRLRPLVYVSDDGPRVRTARFHDLERDEECSFQKDDQGTWRCFPTAVASDFGSPLYPDITPACDGPYTATIGVPNPAYAAMTDRQGVCGTRLFELGPALGDDTACGVVSGLDNPHARGARIPNDAFVRAAETVVERGGDVLALTQLTAEDGSARIQGFYDLGAGAACEVGSLYGDVRCVTSPVGKQGFWPSELEMEGEECWDLVLVTDGCETPRTGIVRISDQNHAATVLPERAVKNPRPAVADCLAVAHKTFAATYWLFGDEIPAETFPELYEASQDGQRLIARWFGDESASVVLPDDDGNAGFTDTRFGTTCGLNVAADGITRCTPYNAASRYADAACTQPLLYWSSSEPPPRFTTDLTVDGRLHVYETKDLYTGPIFKDNSDDRSDCVPDDLQYTYYATGAEVSPDDFVRYDLVEVE